MSILMRRGYTPALDEPLCHEDNRPEILGVTGAFMAAAVIAVALRFYVRVRMLKFTGMDDYTMFAAALMAVGTYICFVGESRWGTGRHTACLTVPDTEMVLKWEYFHNLWVMFGVVLVKISIAFFLMRLAPREMWKRCLWGAIVFLTCFALACAGTLIFSCVPIAASWDFAVRADPKTKCFSIATFSAIGLMNSVINIVTDFVFAIAPIPIILGLQVNTRTKVSLAFVLSLGFIACAAGIVKATQQAHFLSNPDLYWKFGFMVWNMIELCLGILAASLPSLKPLFSSVLASSRTALGLSSSNRSGIPKSHTHGNGNSTPFSQASGYKRQYDPRDIHGILSDAEMHDYNPKSGTTTTTVKAHSDDSGDSMEMAHVAKAKRPYNVRITSRDMKSDVEKEWEGAGNLQRSESEERLHYPSGVGIYRTTEVSRTSEMRS